MCGGNLLWRSFAIDYLWIDYAFYVGYIVDLQETELPLVYEDEDTRYYEGELEGVEMRYALGKDQEPLPPNLPLLLARAWKKNKESS